MLDSTSTLAEIKAAYADNASYSEAESVEKARAFVTACRLLLMRLPKRVSHGGAGTEEVELQPELIAGQLEAAEKWLHVRLAVQNSPRTTYSDFSDFR